MTMYMQRTQIYLTEEQQRRLAQRASDAGMSKSEAIRRILDEALGIEMSREDRLAAVEATAGLWADYPEEEFNEYLRWLRGEGADERLRRLGL